MRSAKYIIILLMALSAGFAYAQTQPEKGISVEREVLTASVNIFPNPATEYLNIRVEHLESSKIKLALHNILGNPMDIETEIVNEHEVRIKVKDLSTGYYLLAIKDEESKFRGTYKFLKR